MHCPDNVDGKTYVEVVAAVSILLSEPFDAIHTYILAELLQSVSYQLFMLAAFKETNEARLFAARKRLEEIQKQADADPD